MHRWLWETCNVAHLNVFLFLDLFTGIIIFCDGLFLVVIWYCFYSVERRLYIDYVSKVIFLQWNFVMRCWLRRQRATEAGKSPYVVIFDSFNLRPKGATFQLHNTVSDVVFQAQLFPLQDNTVRLKINEESPLVLRYESPVGDILVEEPQTQRWVFLQKMSS